MKKSLLPILLLSAFVGTLFSADSPFVNNEDILIYALAEDYTITPEGRLSAGGTLEYLPNMEVDSSNQTVSISFIPRKVDAVYTVQVSTDLQSWTSLPTPIGTLGQLHTVASGLPMDENPRQFMRLKVVIVPVFVDVDGDGLDDNWERSYFGDINMANGASVLSDFNGLTALDAYRHGLDPTAPLAGQLDAVESYTYDGRGWLTSRSVEAVTSVYSHDAEGNLNPAVE